MKANELRIGNLVYLNNPESWEEYINEVVKIEGIDLNISSREKEIWKESFGSLKLVCDKQEFNQFSEYAKPIPLTEEWLFNFGYELMPSGTYLSPNSGNFIWFENGLEDCSICGEYYIKHIKYVHQLQNLYFALTREELTIKN